MENKLTVVARDGVALVGSHFHELKDESKAELATTDIESFLKFVKAKAGVIFYDYQTITAYNSVAEVTNNTAPISSCTLCVTDILRTLQAKNNRGMSLEEFETFLLTFRPYLDQKALDLLSNLRDFRVSKVTDIERQKDNKGNYKFSISRQANAKTQFEPPEKISFEVSVFEHLPDTITVPMEFSFDYKEIEDEDDESKHTVQMVFTVRNMQLDELFKARCKEIVQEVISGLSAEKYWGALKIHKLNDSWKFKENPLRG